MIEPEKITSLIEVDEDTRIVNIKNTEIVEDKEIVLYQRVTFWQFIKDILKEFINKVRLKWKKMKLKKSK